MLEVEQLNITFYDRNQSENVVKDFSMIMQQGEKIGIVGDSGSGKSMTAWAIAGLTKHEYMEKTGRILWKGMDLVSCTLEELQKVQGKDIGIVFQEPMTSLNPVRTIGWQIEEPLKIHGNFTKKERYEKVIHALEEVEIKNPSKVYYQYPHELSGGMRQRVMIAMAMILEPSLLIADEPTTALDGKVQGQIVELLNQLNQKKKVGILFISHDLALVKSLCNRVMVMEKGSIVGDGSAEELLGRKQELSATNSFLTRESQEKLLIVDSLEVRYPNNYESVFENLSFSIDRGEILGIIGESGGGKSTLAKAVTGLIEKSSGTIASFASSIQMVFQDPASSLNPARTVGWILEEPLKIKGGFTKRERCDKVRVMLDKVGLEEHHKDSFPKQLSGGQRQRVAIALALMLEPDLIVADEPVSALDVKIQEQIIQLLLTLQQEYQLSILFISHDLNVVERLCNRILIMKEGQLVCYKDSIQTMQ